MLNLDHLQSYRVPIGKQEMKAWKQLARTVENFQFATLLERLQVFLQETGTILL